MPFLNLWIIEIQKGANQSVTRGRLCQQLFLKGTVANPELPLTQTPLATSPISPQFSSLSLFPLTIDRVFHLRLTALLPPDCNMHWMSRKGGCWWSDAWSPSFGRWTPRSLSKVMLVTQFLAIFCAFPPLFTVRPPVLEWALHPLQNRAALIDESSPFKSQLLFTWLPRIFSVN